jgi:tetratricopeptide (TPR) repeat protein
LAKGQADTAEEKLWPLAKASKRWLASFMDLAAREAPAEAGKKWLTLAKSELGPELAMHTLFANCMVALYRRSGDKALLGMTQADLRAAVDGSKESPITIAAADVVLGMLSEMTDAPAEAEAAYRKAIELNPKSDVAYNNLAMVLAKRGAAAEAATYCDKAIELSPNTAAYHDTLAYVKARAGDFGSAVNHMQTAIQLDPNNVEWRINMSQIYLDAGQEDKARTALINVDGTQLRDDQLGGSLKDKLASLEQRLGM